MPSRGVHQSFKFLQTLGGTMHNELGQHSGLPPSAARLFSLGCVQRNKCDCGPRAALRTRIIGNTLSSDTFEIAALAQHPRVCCTLGCSQRPPPQYRMSCCLAWARLRQQLLQAVARPSERDAALLAALLAMVSASLLHTLRLSPVCPRCIWAVCFLRSPKRAHHKCPTL